MLIKRSNLTQQYADIYLLQSHYYMFRASQHPSSRALKTVTATSGIGHNTGTATSNSPEQITLEGSSSTSIMTYTRGSGYSF